MDAWGHWSAILAVSRRLWFIVAGVALTGLVGSIALGRLGDSQPDRGSAEAEYDLRVTADVEMRTLEQGVVVQGAVGRAETGTARAAAAGRVTTIGVGRGDVLEAGDVMMRIDGRPMVAVEGSVPFHRELGRGDTGDDVGELQRILAAAGYLSADPDDSFGSATESALETWQEQYGVQPVSGRLGLNDMLVGDWPLNVGSVSVRVGDFVAPGTELFVLRRLDSTVNVEFTPTQRLLVATGVPARVEVPATGQMSPGTMVEVASSPVTREGGSLMYPAVVTLDATLDVPEGTQVRVAVLLDRVEALAVPLAAVLAGGGGEPLVRVVRPDGTLEPVPVDLGMSDGAWVEVRSGLRGDELVLVVER